LILLSWLYIVRRNSFSCNFDFSKLLWLNNGHLVNILLASLFSTPVTWKNQNYTRKMFA
jgi:hypothetical protein